MKIVSSSDMAMIDSGVAIMNSKQKAIRDRIKRIEDEITKGREYLESGQHADWPAFRPFFVAKMRDGKRQPPHKDWVKSVFLPSRERALRRAEKTLERIESASSR